MPNYSAGLKIIGNGSYGVINPNLKFVVQIIEHKHLHWDGDEAVLKNKDDEQMSLTTKALELDTF